MFTLNNVLLSSTSDRGLSPAGHTHLDSGTSSEVFTLNYPARGVLNNSFHLITSALPKEQNVMQQVVTHPGVHRSLVCP